MAQIVLEQINFSFAGSLILENIAWRIDDTKRIGLVGRNGTGKTTLLRLIVGELHPDKGSMQPSKDVRLGYLRQGHQLGTGESLWDSMLAVFKDLLSVREEMTQLEEAMTTGASNEDLLKRYGRLVEEWERRGGYTYPDRIRAVLYGLGFRESDLDRELETFSGGERNRAALAALLLSDPNLLLLDEPTNHLDIEATEWLEDYLLSFHGGCVVISHDRYFLDRVCQEIAEIEHHRLFAYKGNYSQYLDQKADRIEREQALFERQQEFIARTEDFIRRNIAGQKTKQAQSRRKMLSKIDRFEQPKTDGRKMGLAFRIDHAGGRIPLETTRLGRQFDGRWVVRDAELKVERGEKIGLIGANGTGKSTLLRILAGKMDATTGEVFRGPDIHIGYYDQHLRNLSPRKTVLEELWDEFPFLTQEEARSFLGRFLFSGDDVFKSISALSGGEAARVSLAKLMMEGANLLLLDEPTNHLDIRSCEILEQALSDYPGTMIMVTHDRFFLDAVVDKIWHLEGATIREYLGNYSYYRDKRDEERQLLAAAQSTQHKIDDVENRKLSKRDLRKARAEFRRESGPTAKSLEQRVYQLEDEIRALQLTAARPEYSSDWQRLADLHAEEQSLTVELHDVMKEWEAALEREQQEGL